MKPELNKESIALSGPDGPLCSMGKSYYMITGKAMLMLKEEYKKSNIESLQGL